MTPYWLTEDATQAPHRLVGRDPDGADVVALPCPWHVDQVPSCICALTYGRFWCVACDREGTCVFAYDWDRRARKDSAA